MTKTEMAFRGVTLALLLAISVEGWLMLQELRSIDQSAGYLTRYVCGDTNNPCVIDGYVNVR